MSLVANLHIVLQRWRKRKMDDSSNIRLIQTLQTKNAQKQKNMKQKNKRKGNKIKQRREEEEEERKRKARKDQEDNYRSTSR